jgi:PhnB protein
MAAGMPPETHDKVLHAALTGANVALMGSDMIGTEGYTPGNTVYLCLVCESNEEINTLFSKLSAGGKVTHPLKAEFFGTFGELTDKYGFKWMFQFSTRLKK